MKLRILTVCMDESGRFDDRGLAEFCEVNEIAAVHERMVELGGEPRWALLVEYRPRAESGGYIRGQRGDEGLSGEERRGYELIRRWRNGKARHEGVPAYLVLTNSEVAEICRRKPRTLSQLRDISGIGEGKCKSYGAEILELVKEVGFGRTGGEPDGRASGGGAKEQGGSNEPENGGNAGQGEVSEGERREEPGGTHENE